VLGYLLRRLAVSLLLLLVVLSLTFVFLHLAPGDPTRLQRDPRASRQQLEAQRHLYGLDRPLHQQYLVWLQAVVLKGDWGVSFSHHRPVTRVLAQHLPNTLLLALAAMVVQYAVGISLGISAAVHAGSRRDRWIRLGSLGLYSLPLFWLGLISLLLFSYAWSLFPPGHMRSVDAAELSGAGRLLDLLHHLALPALVLGLGSAGAVVRFVRTSLLEVSGEAFILAARARGLTPRRVVWVHALRKAAVPLIQVFGLSLPFLLSGSLVIEVIFSWPGVGRVSYDAILARDYPLVLAGTALTAALVVAGNLLADLLHAAVEPRVRRA